MLPVRPENALASSVAIQEGFKRMASALSSSKTALSLRRSQPLLKAGFPVAGLLPAEADMVAQAQSSCSASP